ncbi:MAG: type 4a pilus biogenesis protein PilO [Sedimenticola sp.]
MNLEELNDLDFSNIGLWPAPVKGFIVLLLCAAVGVGWYYWDTEAQRLNLDKVVKQESGLRSQFTVKQAKAANLEKYKKQLEEMKQSFGTMLRQLPNKTEVADLLVDVSQTGLAAGLEFELFDPQGEVQREFYAELPIKIKVHGTYHEFGGFISGIAALPRIVTIHDVVVAGPNKRVAKVQDSQAVTKLIMTATAKTYRYLDEEAGK